MSALVAADLLKFRRRRLLAASAVGLPLFFGFLFVVLTATDVIEADGGAVFYEDFVFGMSTLGTIVLIVVGARLGSEEHAAGTLRYQLLTGVPRGRLYLSKVLAAVVIVLVVVVACVVPALVGAALIGDDGGPAVTGEMIGEGVWNLVVTLLVPALIALGIGGLFRSTGPAITIALFLNLLGIQLVLLLTLIDDSLRNVVLSLGVNRLTFNDVDADDAVSLGAALVVVPAWVAAFLAAGWARLRNLEA